MAWRKVFMLVASAWRRSVWRFGQMGRSILTLRTCLQKTANQELHTPPTGLPKIRAQLWLYRDQNDAFTNSRSKLTASSLPPQKKKKSLSVGSLTYLAMARGHAWARLTCVGRLGEGELSVEKLRLFDPPVGTLSVKKPFENLECQQVL